jgi:hypothetical protein
VRGDTVRQRRMFIYPRVLYKPMAELKSVERNAKDIKVTLKLTSDEYGMISKSWDDILLSPVNDAQFSEELTTGRLGNGNRVMLPKKILERHGVKLLKKKLPAAIFEVEGRTYLLAKLKEKKPGVPVYREG